MPAASMTCTSPLIVYTGTAASQNSLQAICNQDLLRRSGTMAHPCKNLLILCIAGACRTLWPCGECCPEGLLLRLVSSAELPMVEVKHDGDAWVPHAGQQQQ